MALSDAAHAGRRDRVAADEVNRLRPRGI
jgi:hypothetical protein